MINDLTGDALNAITMRISQASQDAPCTRQEIAQTANVERQAVGEILSELRLQGYLVLETENGCWLGTSFTEYKEWRSTMLIPAMLLLLRIDQAMARAAVTQFGADRIQTG